MIEHVFHDGGRAAAGFKGQTRDCVARAIAIAADLRYAEVYAQLAMGNATGRGNLHRAAGRKTAAMGIDTNARWFCEYMDRLGFVWTPTMRIGSGCRVHLRADELPSGRLIVQLSRHVAAVIDGCLLDTYDCSRGGTRCVYGYWKRT